MRIRCRELTGFGLLVGIQALGNDVGEAGFRAAADVPARLSLGHDLDFGGFQVRITFGQHWWASHQWHPGTRPFSRGRLLVTWAEAGQAANGVEAAKASAESLDSVEKIRTLLAKVQVGTDDEYRVIHPVWEEALAAGKRNQADELKDILDLATPRKDEPLRDWQAVVIGGGIINGLGQEGAVAAHRIQEIIKGDDAFAERWQAMLAASRAMVINEKIRPGTRYDALRILALLPFEEGRPIFESVLKTEKNEELLDGAVAGLADVPDAKAVSLLLKRLPGLPANVRANAIAALIRPQGDGVRLLDAVAEGHLSAQDVPDDIRTQLLTHESESIRSRSIKLLKK